MNIYGVNNFIGNHNILRVSCDHTIYVWATAIKTFCFFYNKQTQITSKRIIMLCYITGWSEIVFNFFFLTNKSFNF